MKTFDTFFEAAPSARFFAVPVKTAFVPFSWFSIALLAVAATTFALLNTYYSKIACKMSHTPNFYLSLLPHSPSFEEEGEKIRESIEFFIKTNIFAAQLDSEFYIRIAVVSD